MSYTDQYSPLPTAPRTRRMSPQLGNGTGMAAGGGVSSPGQIGMMHPGLLAPSAPMSYSGAPQTMAAPMGPSLQQQNMGIAPRGPSPNSTAGMAQAGIQYPGLAMRQASQAYGRANVAMSAPAPSLSSPGGTASAILPGGGSLSHTYSPTMRPQGEVDQVMHDRQAYADRQNLAGDMAMLPSTGSPNTSFDRQTAGAFAAAAPGRFAAETKAISDAPAAAAGAAMIKSLPAFLNAQTNAKKAQDAQSNAERTFQQHGATTQDTASRENAREKRLQQEADQSGKDTPAAQEMNIVNSAMKLANDPAGQFYGDMEGAVRAAHQAHTLAAQLIAGGATPATQPQGQPQSNANTPYSPSTAGPTTQPSGGGSHRFTAVNKQTGQRMGSNDGKNWEPIQ